MGNTSHPSTQHFSTKFYKIQQQKSQNWSGTYIQMQDPLHKSSILKKSIYLRSHSEAKQFLTRHATENKPEFYVINPIHLQLDKQQGICSLSQTINIYHHPLLPSLADRINKTNQLIKESEIWFILSELVHGLDILHGRNHPHLWIAPETIYYNFNENWFLQDMCYWEGYDYQNLISCKLQAQELISLYVKDIVAKGEMIHLTLSFDEDIYNLGYTVMYMMTAIPGAQAQKNSSFIFQRALQNGYSKKLISLIRTMIDQIPERRISLEKLKFKLKMEESKIIKEEMEEYRRERRKKSNSDRLATGTIGTSPATLSGSTQLQKNFIPQPPSLQIPRKISYQPQPQINSTTINPNPTTINPTTTNNNNNHQQQTQTKINSSPQSFYSKSLSPINLFSDSGVRMRRDFVYLSPPHNYRLMDDRSPDYYEVRKGPSEFRFNSPRK